MAYGGVVLVFLVAVYKCCNFNIARIDHRTVTALLSEVKHCLAWLVLRWGTTLESQVLIFCFLVIVLSLLKLSSYSSSRVIFLILCVGAIFSASAHNFLAYTKYGLTVSFTVGPLWSAVFFCYF